MAHEAGDGEHATLGASGFDRWSVCAPSANLAEQLNVEHAGSSPYAREGTAAHYVAEQCLRRGYEEWRFLGETVRVEGEEFIVDGEMADAVSVFVDFVESWMPYADEVGIEEKVRLASYEVDRPLFGTADATILRYGIQPTLIVADYKHGVGVPVWPEDTGQIAYYAVGKLDQLKRAGVTIPDDAEVWLVVVQPRAPYGDSVRIHKTTADDLYTWAGMELHPAAWTADRDPRAPFVTGEHCRFCPVAQHCPALRYAFDQVVAQSADEDWRYILDNLEPAKRYIRAVEDKVQAKLMAGEEVPGYKLVHKRAPPRQWRQGDEAKLDEALGEQAFEKRRLSPAQVEKLGEHGKSLVAQLAYRPEPGYTFAPSDDKRDAVTPRTAADAFAHD